MFNTESKTERALQAKRRYRLPKRAFDLYISAPTHNKKTRKKPMIVYMLPVFIVIMLALVYRSYHSVMGKTIPVKQASAASEEPATTSKQPGTVSSGIVRHDLSVDSYKPAVFGRPETAPVFDEIRHVVTFPMVSACVATASKCLCYSQQGTRLGDVNEERCRQLVSSGFQFNPYQASHQQNSQPLL